jgi:hypothetical protein
LLIDSLNLNLNTGMIYDDKMRDRIVQLLLNQYQEDELDTLIKYDMADMVVAYEKDAMDRCKFDTLIIFKNALDSLYTKLINENEINLNKKYNKIYDYEIFKALKLDTTIIFKQTYTEIVKKTRAKYQEYYLTKTYYDHTYIAMLCGYINDKRFIKPLIKALDKPDNFQQKKVLEALVRMRVEPYYSDYVKKRTLTMEQIIDEKKWFDFEIDNFVYVLGTQEAFLELSKYLLSDCPYSWFSGEDGYTSIPVKAEAFDLICRNIENKELKELINNKNIYDDTTITLSLYNWMQKNYGKYKIKRIW